MGESRGAVVAALIWAARTTSASPARHSTAHRSSRPARARPLLPRENNGALHVVAHKPLCLRRRVQARPCQRFLHFKQRPLSRLLRQPLAPSGTVAAVIR